ncbi:DoxX family protein [Mucilaginibacter terrae]|uniref:Membrane protein YphA (DoxX/SURF4 family) n=1 Tax=Mucilaginibacter terrae TaxID=1955052 RepID=A0ABU3GUC8_9SPHI|nr:DoxX family protein [Mucilaginibacter terrae]MDT3403380.1 putative membrane protein YphA (DoxX/SURF4 family) [Mucilaginibacter terrae]
MNLIKKLDELHLWARQNKWLGYFTIFCRLSLAAGFIMAGFVKVKGERFTNLSNNQPMGHYLEALYHTGYYYTFVGILQMLAGALLVFRRTATLGAVLYFPIILNILILSLSVRFEGSLLSSPLMVLANLYLLCWDYDKLKYIMPYYRMPKPVGTDKKFPFKFFAGSAATIAIIIFIITHIYNIMPRNTERDCKRQCKNNINPHACEVFCDDIHNQGKPFDQSLEAYDRAVKAK